MQKNSCILSIILINLLLLSSFSYPANLYWTNNAGDNDWHNANNWSTSTVPTSSDIAHFDTTSTADCNLSNTATAQGVYLHSGYTGTLNINGFSLSIGANGLTLEDSSCIVTVGTSGILSCSGDINVVNGTLDAGQNYAKVSCSKLNVDGSFFAPFAGSITCSDNITITGVFSENTSTLELNGTTLLTTNTNSFHHIYLFDTASFTLNDDLTITGNLSAEAGATITEFDLNGMTLRVEGVDFNISNIESFQSSGSTVKFYGQLPTPVSINAGANTFDTVILGAEGAMRLNNDLQILGDFLVEAGSTEELDLQIYQLIFKGTSVDFNNLTNLLYSTGGTIVFDGNISFFPPPLLSLPDIMIGSSANVVFNANTTISGSIAVQTGGSPTLDFNSGYHTFSSNVNFTNLGSLNATGSTVKFSGSTTLTCAGMTFENIEIDTTGSLTLNDTLIMMGSLSVLGSSTSSLNLNSQTLKIGGHLNLTNLTTFNNTGTIEFIGSAPQTITAAGNSFTDIIVKNNTGEVYFADATNFTNFTCIAPNANLKFNAGATYGITGSLILNGSDVNTKINLYSDTAGTRFTFNVSVPQNVYFVDVIDSEVTTANIYGTASHNSGNTDFFEAAPHWVFSPEALYSASITFITHEAGTTNEVTVDFTPTNNIPINGKIVIDLPGSYYCLSDTVYGVTGLSGTFSITLSSGDGLNDIVTIIRNNDGATEGADIPISITINKVRIPQVSGNTPPFKIYTKTSLDLPVDLTDNIPGVPILPNYLKNIILSQETYIAGELGNFSFTFETTNPIPYDGKIKVVFPALYNTSNSNAVIYTYYIDGTFTVIPTNEVNAYDAVIISRNGDGMTVPANTLVSLTINNIKNPPRSDWPDTFKVSTAVQDGRIIDEEFTSATFNIEPGLLLSPEVQPASLYPGAVGDVLVSFKTKNPIPQDGWIVVGFPPEFDLSGCNSLTNPVSINGGFNIEVSDFNNDGFISEVIVKRDNTGTPVPEFTDVSFTLNNIKNPLNIGPTGPYDLHTIDYENNVPYLIDEAFSIPADNINDSIAPTCTINLIYHPSISYPYRPSGVMVNLFPSKPIMTPEIYYIYTQNSSQYIRHLSMKLCSTETDSVWFSFEPLQYFNSDIEFHVKMTDVAGNIGTQITNLTNNTFYFETKTFNVPGNQWILKGLTGIKKVMTLNTLLKISIPHIIYKYEREVQSYLPVLSTEPYSLGEAGWYLGNADTSFSLPALYSKPINFLDAVAETPDLDETDLIISSSTFIDIHQGWNIIANPYSFPIPVDRVLIQPGPEYDHVIKEVADSNLVDNVIWGYNDLSGGFYPIDLDEGMLDVTEGFFIYTLTNEAYAFFVPTTGPDIVTKANTKSTNLNQLFTRNKTEYYKALRKPKNFLPHLSKSTGTQWQIRLIVKTEKFEDAHTYIGQSPLASSHIDKFDHRKPPAIAGILRTGLAKSLNSQVAEFGVDLKSSNDLNPVWYFEVQTPKPLMNFTILPENLSDLPAGKFLCLVDETDREHVFSNNQPYLSFKSDTNKKAFFRIKLIDSSLAVTSTSADYTVNAYPNPVTGTELNLKLNIAESTYTTIKIYDASGKKVRTLLNNYIVSISDNTVQWDLTRADGREVSNGIYFVKVSLKPVSGGEYNHTLKVAILR